MGSLLTSAANLSHNPVCHSVNLSTFSFGKNPEVPSRIRGSTEIVLVVDRRVEGEVWNCLPEVMTPLARATFRIVMGATVAVETRRRAEAVLIAALDILYI